MKNFKYKGKFKSGKVKSNFELLYRGFTPLGKAKMYWNKIKEWKISEYKIVIYKKNWKLVGFDISQKSTISSAKIHIVSQKKK